MSIYLPNPNDPRVREFIEANGPATGSINDRFAGALRSVLELEDADLQICDLWKLFLIEKYGSFRGLNINNYEPESEFTFDLPEED